MVKKPAFTLIELVFAIVIITITVISLPMMNQSISKGIDTNLVQEAIFAAATELQETTTTFWDEASTDKNSSNDISKVINIDDTCEDNQSNPRYRLRPGHILQSLHRKCLNDLDRNASYSQTNDSIDAVEDKVHEYREIFLNSTSDAAGYKHKYKSLVAVTYDPTFNVNTRPDMKKVTITVQDENNNTITSLFTYVANIGGVDYYKRTY